MIDVEGKQCSDFLAFHRGKLESGLERGLDATTTRSLMGHAYPQPGLYAKFYDVDQDPLIEVVRDTVGRHDSFGLACTARYYEDQGYPGHVNCSENFNGQVTPFGIAPRMGWEALNFFYNTGFDANNVFVMDEPWSRPGDYVLLKAMNDLVCASSACPDDIDPANGWQITPGPRAGVRTRQLVLGRDRAPRDRGRRPGAHSRDDVPSTDERAHEELRRVPRLLASALLRQRGRDRRVLGMPREDRDHGSLATSQVGGARPRRRDPDPARDHARRTAALGRPGHVHGALQRDGRDDRRRDRLPPRAGQLPLRRRRRVRRDLAERAAREA